MIQRTAREETDLRYAICIGINNYASSAQLSPLQYAENDAQAMHEVLLEQRFAQERCHLLLGAEATTKAINDILMEYILSKPKRNDLILFYFAGHGVRIPSPDDDDVETMSDVFLTSYDFDWQHLAQERAAWLNYPLRFGCLKEDFFERTRSKKVLFLLDSCYSGDFFGAKYRGETSIQHSFDRSFAKMSSGRLVLSSCLPLQEAREDEKLSHGLFTHYLLQALYGQARGAINRDGIMTINSLFDYLCKIMPDTQCPVKSGVQHGLFKLLYYPQWDETKQALASPVIEAHNQREEKKIRLESMIANHRDFLQSRLDSFVGRAQELAHLQRLIEQKMETGGYITITGQVGQGKSSIIAKLIDHYGPENVAFHFIPFNRGPDYQVGLLRTIMARLVLKYDLSESYVAGEFRTTFRDFFPRVLEDVAAKDGREIIFIDGLDQLEMDENDLRDLSFLPDHLPIGIVCVLGTRPNDTLNPLELLQPHDTYPLPNLSRSDFDLILHHRHVSLARTLADQFYQAMQENVLYLDLVAKELYERETFAPEDLIARLTHDPNHIFSLAVGRLEQPATEWDEVLKPILGVLLTARKPLSDLSIRHILNIDHNRNIDHAKISKALKRLGGLLSVDSDHHYSLFHLQFKYYLRQDKQQPQKKCVFATDEEESWHAKLASWCEKGSLAAIWEDTKKSNELERRSYAREHVIAHWYYAHQWQRLFEILDDKSYGQAKMRYDPSLRSYIQDLDYGRKAAIWEEWNLDEGIAHLPRLWCYTLLRCSLKNRADQYPLATFRLLLLLDREKEVIGLAELLTNASFKVTVLLEIAQHFLLSKTDPLESRQLFLRAEMMARSIEDGSSKVRALCELATTLVQTQQWEQAEPLWQEAEMVARSIEDIFAKSEALRELAAALAQAQQCNQAEPLWQEAEMVVRSIDVPFFSNAKPLSKLVTALVQAQRWEQAEKLIRSIENSLFSKAEALSELGTALAQAQQWEYAETVARSIEDCAPKVRVLSKLATSLAQAQQWEQAKTLWQEAETVARFIEPNLSKAVALNELAASLAQAQQWEQVEPLWQEAETMLDNGDSDIRARALSELVIALAQDQRWEQARAVARSIKNNFSSKVGVLSELASIMVQAQQLKQAEAVIGSIKGSFSKAEALSKLGIAFANIGQKNHAKTLCGRAETVIHTMPDDQANTRVLSELAMVMIQEKQWEQAEAVVRSINNNSSSKSGALCELATALTQAQRWEQAKALWQEAEVVARSIEDNSSKIKAFNELATALIQAQRWEQAEAVTRSIEDNTSKARTLSKLSIALTQTQQWEQAEKVARSIEDDSSKARALSKLAKAFAQSQQWEQAEVIARSIDDKEAKAGALGNLSIALAQAQQQEQAEFFWQETEKVIRSLENVRSAAKVLNKLGIALLQTQWWEQAESLWQAAEEMSDHVIDGIASMSKARALSELAINLVQKQQWEKAEKVARSVNDIFFPTARALSELATALVLAQQWERAEIIARSIEDNETKVETLSKLAVDLAQAQQWEHAEKVARSIEDDSSKARKFKAEALSELAAVLPVPERWEQAKILWQEAEKVANSIEDSVSKAKALIKLTMDLLQAQQWKAAEEVVRSIKDSSSQARSLHAFVTSLLEGNKEEEILLHTVQSTWLQIETRDDAFRSFRLAFDLIPLQPEIISDFCKAFQLVETYTGSEPFVPSMHLDQESASVSSGHTPTSDVQESPATSGSGLTVIFHHLGSQSLLDSDISSMAELLSQLLEDYSE